MAEKESKPEGLDLLRVPFAAHHISKLPKPTKAQTEAVRADFKKGIRCTLCGSWHHPDVIHLDYVGHAALTDRLLDCDPHWYWEPLAFHDGLPAFDNSGGLWIKLTVCGITRLGYGHAASKPGVDPGSREKEVIGDALRNAAMRFGAALDLWHKGDLHADEAEEVKDDAPETITPAQVKQLRKIIVDGDISESAFCEHVKVDKLESIPAEHFANAKAMLEKKAKARKPAPTPEVADDEIPY